MANKIAPTRTLFQRVAPLLVGAGLLLLATVVITSGVAAKLHLPFGVGRPKLAGFDLGETPAPNFRLRSGSGRQVTLAALRGKAVALTFIYTSCPDVCPLITQKFHQAYTQLGPDAGKVAFVAITVDPETDTPRRINEYSQAMGMTGKWEFLTGTRTELTPIWKAYGVEPVSVQQADLLVQKDASGAQNGPAFQGVHSALVYVIDPLGRERRLLDPDFTATQLAGDLRSLAANAS